MRLIPGEFIGASGMPLPFKIECDDYTPEEWAVIAKACAPKIPAFGRVIGVPRGGVALAKAMKPYLMKGHPYTLICDDVWSFGSSMRQQVKKLGLSVKEWHGLVAYSRYPLPIHVRAFMQLMV